MTHDHIDSFSEAMEREGRGYVVIIHGPKEQRPGGAHVRTHLENWPVSRAGISKQRDTLEALMAAYTADDEHFKLLTADDASKVLGALDTLATLLADHNHHWTDGERTIYEQACELLGAGGQPKNE